MELLSEPATHCLGLVEDALLPSGMPVAVAQCLPETQRNQAIATELPDRGDSRADQKGGRWVAELQLRLRSCHNDSYVCHLPDG
jgi:hypothetical protein